MEVVIFKAFVIITNSITLLVAEVNNVYLDTSFASREGVSQKRVGHCGVSAIAI